MSEHQHQCAVIEWFGLQYPNMSRLLFSIPNGAHLSGDARVRAIKMRKMKDEGLRPGVSDLFLMVPRHGTHGLWIEMKDVGGKKPNSDQIEFQKDANDQGYVAVTCYGFDMAKGAIEQYLK